MQSNNKNFQQLSLQDYLTFYSGGCADNLTRSQLKQILSIHGFVQLSSSRKEDLMHAVRSLPMISPVRSTINTNLVPLISLHVASLSVLEMTQDMRVIGWEEGPIESVKTIEPKVPSISLSFKVEQVPKTDRKLKEKDKGAPSICALPSRKLKSEVKKTIHVVATSLKDVDNGSWKNNGSQWVKGLATQRAYFKCKKPFCQVMKYVDNDPNNPSMCIVTYQGEHNHDIS